MLWKRTGEDALVRRVFGRGSSRGSTWFGRFGDVAQHPPVWAVVASGLVLLGGARGRRAALRGGVGYTVAVLAHLPIKALVNRRHPPGAAFLNLGPFTSSFPSGHAASDLAFIFGVSQEIPKMFVPLSAVTTAAHWTLMRRRAHYPSDILAGGALGIAVALAMWKLWPPEDGPSSPSGPLSGGDDHRSGGQNGGVMFEPAAPPGDHQR